MTATEREPLTPREVAVCVAIADGCSSREIARQQHLSVDGVKSVIRRVFGKVGVRARTSLVAAVIRAEVIAFDDAGRPVPGPCAGRLVPGPVRVATSDFWFDREIPPHVAEDAVLTARTALRRRAS